MIIRKSSLLENKHISKQLNKDIIQYINKNTLFIKTNINTQKHNNNHSYYSVKSIKITDLFLLFEGEKSRYFSTERYKDSV